MKKVRLKEKLATFNEHWSPKIVGELNSQHVKVVKFQGDFVWHRHEREDEMFLVLKGEFDMRYRDSSGIEQTLLISEGEFVIVPHGTEHRPHADSEVHVLLFEPAGTVNTGNIQDSRTVTSPETI
jgi:mannose-6-phosphate isomerase-like protein (cupin superfamily)